MAGFTGNNEKGRGSFDLYRETNARVHVRGNGNFEGFFCREDKSHIYLCPTIVWQTHFNLDKGTFAMPTVSGGRETQINKMDVTAIEPLPQDYLERVTQEAWEAKEPTKIISLDGYYNKR